MAVPTPPSACLHDGVHTWCTWHRSSLNFTVCLFFFIFLMKLTVCSWKIDFAALSLSANLATNDASRIEKLGGWLFILCLCAFHPAECIVYFIFYPQLSRLWLFVFVFFLSHSSALINQSLHLTSSERAQLGKIVSFSKGSGITEAFWGLQYPNLPSAQD